TVIDDQEDASKQGGIIGLIDTDEDFILEEVDAAKDAKVAEDEDDDEPEPAELKEVIKVITTTKLMTEVVTAAPIIVAIITAAPSAARKRKGVVIRDPKEAATPSTIVHSKPKSKDKGKGILVKEPKPLKKQAQIEQDDAYARELEAELNKNINWDDVIEQYFNSNVAFLEKNEKELEEEASRALKRKTKSSEEKAAKKQKEDLEVLWQIVQEIFASSKPNNFSDNFLLTALKTMFEKPDVKAQVWKNQRGIYDDLASREKISLDKIHFRSDAQQYTVIDDQEDASKQGGIIGLIDTDEDFILEEVDAAKDAKVAEDADDDELEPAELKEVIKVITTTKLMTEVVTAAATAITAAPIIVAIITAAPSAARKRKGVVIRDPKEAATPSTIVHSKPKSKDKGKGILVKERKPLKKQAQIEQDDAYARVRG
nr:hypothetical protein [Tanacetum cinerariifolium]